MPYPGPHGLSGSRSCPAPIEENMLISDGKRSSYNTITVIVDVSGDPNNIIQLLSFHSLEPGFYETGEFGIRIESVMVFKKADTKVSMCECVWVCTHTSV